MPHRARVQHAAGRGPRAATAHILDFADNAPELALKEALTGLQLHAGKPMWAEFKDVRVKDLK